MGFLRLSDYSKDFLLGLTNELPTQKYSKRDFQWHCECFEEITAEEVASALQTLLQ
jgi:hypothetical protein